MPLALPAALCWGLLAGTPMARADSGQSSQDLTSLQTVDTTSLSTAALAPGLASGARPAAGLVMQAHARILRPAPLPDQDLEAPEPSAQALAAQGQASLQPSFYSATTHFSGDGFSAGSTLDGDHANRSRAGGGMSLSIPVQ